MTSPQVTILVPNYKTYELTKLCLRLIRKFTDPKLAEVIVIDNASQDASTEYLRKLDWIKFIERQTIPDEKPYLAHGRALDLGLEQVTTPYVLSIHTDTLVKNEKWLDYLIKYIEKSPQVAGVGSWKLLTRPWHRQLAKNIERIGQKAWYKLTNKQDHVIEGVGKNFFYLRSHCALYRTDLLKQFDISFAKGEDTPGRVIHKVLVEQNYEMNFLSESELNKYIEHIDHATMFLNAEFGMKNKGVKKGNKRLNKILNDINATLVLQDASLDT